MVMKLTMGDAKKRSKALKTAVGLPGVQSVTLEEDKIVIVGEGVDSVNLTRILRKKMGYVDLVSLWGKSRGNAPARRVFNIQWYVLPKESIVPFPDNRLHSNGEKELSRVYSPLDTRPHDRVVAVLPPLAVKVRKVHNICPEKVVPKGHSPLPSSKLSKVMLVKIDNA
ncbi:hypothetical protein Cni_G08522 [Canna indica]|uniref:Uncharacterized protein n=1 Tax=Canna indica TaxID=4628 RepID=A0AAQ3Q5U2_9LILI|nr:hypothetical protein Cni_G08522 [Canna indica]